MVSRKGPTSSSMVSRKGPASSSAEFFLLLVIIDGSIAVESDGLQAKGRGGGRGSGHACAGNNRR